MDNADIDAKLSMTLQKALRRPKYGQLEHLLANELAVAAFHPDPLQKIRHIFEAYMVLTEAEAQQTFSQEERCKIEKMYNLCISLLNAVEMRMGPERISVVSFGFSEKQAEEYLGLIGVPPENYEILTEETHPANVRFVIVMFTKAVMPFAVQVMRRIIENFISPETWTQTLLQARRQMQA